MSQSNLNTINEHYLHENNNTYNNLNIISPQDTKRKSIYQKIVNNNLVNNINPSNYTNNNIQNVNSKIISNVPNCSSLKESEECIIKDSTSFVNLNTNRCCLNSTDKNNIIDNLVEKIDNNEELIFDSYILKSTLKEYNLDENKENMGIIYKKLNKEFSKAQILTEMIAQLSKKFLNKSIEKSLLFLLDKKDTCEYIKNKYFSKSNNEHSIEYNILDVFNIFLGKSDTSDEFYLKVLPNYLCDIYKIDYILDIKKLISIPNLFTMMQFHNQIYFHECMEINFEHESPLVTQDIKYISVINSVKWFKSLFSNSNEAKIENDNKSEQNKLNVMSSIAVWNKIKSQEDDEFENNNKNNKNSNKDFKITNSILEDISVTNINRFNYCNFELKNLNQFEKKNKILAVYENDLRIDQFKLIYNLITNKKYELALNICDHYSLKYSETIFLNPLLNLLLAEIYSELLSVELSFAFFEKSISVVNWLYGENKSPLLIDIYFTFAVILLKHTNLDNKEQNNSKNSNINSVCYINEVKSNLQKAINLSNELFNEEYVKGIKADIQLNIFEISEIIHNSNSTLSKEQINDNEENENNYNENNEIYSNSIENKLIRISALLEKLSNKKLYIEAMVYLDLLNSNIENCNIIPDKIKTNFKNR